MRPTHSKGVRRVLDNAHVAAGRYRHRFIHTEYLLLGLLQERNSATKLLKVLGFERERLRDACKRQCKTGEHATEPNQKLTPRTQQVMALAGEQMQALGHSEIDTRHLLLGLLLEEEGIGGKVLRHAGVTYQAVYDEMARPEPDEHESRQSNAKESERFPSRVERPMSKPLWKLFSRT